MNGTYNPYDRSTHVTFGAGGMGLPITDELLLQNLFSNLNNSPKKRKPGNGGGIGGPTVPPVGPGGTGGGGTGGTPLKGSIPLREIPKIEPPTATDLAFKNYNVGGTNVNFAPKTFDTSTSGTGGVGGTGGLTGGLTGIFNKGKQALKNTNWNKKSGLSIGGKNIGKAAPWIQGGVEAVRALGGISDYTDAQSQYDELVSDVLREYGSNPLANQFLTSSQRSDLRALEKGYTNEGSANSGDFFKGMGSGLVEAVPAALLGLATGGVPGALVGGIGSLVNSGISGMNSAVSQDTADLEALYQALVDANAQYNSMKRIPMQGLGLQQKYVNMYQ